jgi:hypothetical protein
MSRPSSISKANVIVFVAVALAFANLTGCARQPEDRNGTDADGRSRSSLGKVSASDTVPLTRPKLDRAYPATDPLSAGRGTYLPLAEGNRWTYRKTILPGGQPRLWSMFPAPKEKGDLVISVGGNHFESGVTEETYLVGKRSSDGRWDVTVTSDMARDGRYAGNFMGSSVQRISWGPMIKRPRPDLIVIDEVIVMSRWPPYGDGPLERVDYLLIETNTSRPSGKHATLWTGWSRVEAEHTSEEIRVPAGQWRHCIRMITNFGKEPIKNTKAHREDATRWSTVSYYARDVGLIKEQQVDHDGRATYTMELTNYSVHGASL